MAHSREFVLTLSCPDREGIGYAVSALLYEAGCNSIDSQQFGDAGHAGSTGRLFMRVRFGAVGRDVESVVLARAMRWPVQHRVPVNGDKTRVFK